MTPRLWGSTAAGRIIRLVLLAGVVASVLVMTGVIGPPRSDATEDPQPFTFVVLPDTQGYTASEADSVIMGQQTQWIRDSRATLNTAFVAQVGDLVESHPSDPMWQRASEHMAVLDDAGVPNSVLPGNHDMNVETGQADKYDQYFGSTRYAGNAWTPSTARYGGYLGEDLYGPDPVDRGNKDSFSIFSAGGMDFLVLSLEYEAPDYALTWAQKVIDNNPDRRVIVSMHDFVDTDSQRGDFNTRKDPDINAAPQIWEELIFPNCSIFMVVSGHWTSRSDPTQGEGRRTDPNACGQPVHQMLSNYQGRPNGGDGWLRYYTFDPATDSISARTYSPLLERFETDADSEFTLDYPMSSRDAGVVVTHSGSGADWRYRFENTAPDPDWAAPGYDASTWQKGVAPLGFGSWGPATDIDASGGDDRPLAAQFRHYVDLTDAASLIAPKVTVFADDGAVIFVNGTEVGRVNMPTGAADETSYAIEARGHDRTMSEPVTFDIPAGLLRDGANTIAAQVSSNYKATADMTFEATVSSTLR